MTSIRWDIAQWFERKWWQNYLKRKSPQDYIAWKKEYWHIFLEEIGLSSNEISFPAIDIGCGPAGIFRVFEDKEITALDPLLAKYEADLPIFSSKEYAKIKFVNNDFESAKLTEKYKTVFCLNAINHFQDINFSFQKLSAITDANGRLILSIDAHNHNLFKYLFRLLPLDILHPHQYDLEEYIAMLEENGFKIKARFCQKKAFFFDYWVLTAEKVLFSHPKK